jgi:hypothetical protein
MGHLKEAKAAAEQLQAETQDGNEPKGQTIGRCLASVVVSLARIADALERKDEAQPS